MKRAILLLVFIAALVGCGSEDKSAESDTADAPATTKEEAPSTTTEETTPAEEQPPSKPPKQNNSDPAAQAQRFSMQMDDYAIALDEATGQALDGDRAATQRIARLRNKIMDGVNDRLLEGGDTSVGGNLLLSAATQARDAARSGNLPRLADARRDIAEARNRLAEELVNEGG